jgi:hypothetical protein
MLKKNKVFDAQFPLSEQLPKIFTAEFKTVSVDSGKRTQVFIDDKQVGDIISDNSREEDGYRFHDVFHYTYAALLGWSPCTRSMMKRKRKSDPSIDEFEDGARATITEEAISLMVFNKALKNNLLDKNGSVCSQLLFWIKEMTDTFEVQARSAEEWEETIQNGYLLFNDLKKNNGGRIHFNTFEKTALFEQTNG